MFILLEYPLAVGTILGAGYHEAIEIINSLDKNRVQSDNRDTTKESEQSIAWFIYSIPAYVFAVIIRDHIDLLSNDEKKLCKNVILDFSSRVFNDNYQYQISDGVDAAISILPVIMTLFPEEQERITKILLFSLFLEYSTGGFFANRNFNRYPITAIRALWNKNPSGASIILFSFLLISQNFEAYLEESREKNNKKRIFNTNYYDCLRSYFEEKNEYIGRILAEEPSLNEFEKIDQQKLAYLGISFELIPAKVENNEVDKLSKYIIAIFSKKLFIDNRKDRVNYDTRHSFLESYSFFLLSLDKGDIYEFLKPFLTNFQSSEVYAELFQELIFTQKELKSNDTFWAIWNLFKDEVVDLSYSEANNFQTEQLIKNYLFANPYWNKDLKRWDTLQPENKAFFREISKKIYPSSSVLYALSMLLFGIGSHYLDEGISWISNIIKNNNELKSTELETNTIYYMENIIRNYLLINRDKVKKIKSLKDSILVILNFLVEIGSVVGYMVRENIF